MPVSAFSQKHDAIAQIEWSKVSRGYEESTRITSDSVNVIAIDRKGTGKNLNFGRKTNPQEWAELVSLVQQVSLKDISKLASPTMDRASDAALHSTITIRDASGKEYSHGFDNDNPNEALKPLIKAISKIRGIKEN